MLSRKFTPFPGLVTNRLELRRITRGDAAEVFFFRTDPEMLRYLERDPAKSIEEAEAWIDMIDEGVNKNQLIAWGISLKDSPTLIGTVNFWNFKPEHYRAEIGYLLHTGYQGRGLMHEAMSAVLDFGFNVIKLHSVEANVNPANEPSIKLLLRNGFVREGYFRENYYYNGKFLDSAIYSLLAPASGTSIHS